MNAIIGLVFYITFKGCLRKWRDWAPRKAQGGARRARRPRGT
jgi:hypothetical protein